MLSLIHSLYLAAVTQLIKHVLTYLHKCNRILIKINSQHNTNVTHMQ